jgi:hypothetical protein
VQAISANDQSKRLVQTGKRSRRSDGRPCRRHKTFAISIDNVNTSLFFLSLAEGAYTQQGRAHSRRLHPSRAARPALMSRAAHTPSRPKPWSASKSRSAHTLASLGPPFFWRGGVCIIQQECAHIKSREGGEGGGLSEVEPVAVRVVEVAVGAEVWVAKAVKAVEAGLVWPAPAPSAGGHPPCELL